MKRIDDVDSDLIETRYVKSMIWGKGEIAVISGLSIFDSIIKSSAGVMVLDEFQYRYNEQKIALRYKYEDYINDKDMQATVTGLGMNPDAFWLLIVFCYDYACDCCNGIRYKNSPREELVEFTDMIIENLIKKNDTFKFEKEMTLTLKMKGKSMSITNANTFMAIVYALETCKDELSDMPFLKGVGRDYYYHSEESDSVLIWYFAKLMLYFFEMNPEFKGRAVKGSGISLNKHVLISNLIYYTGLSRNEKFLNDDETLKGYLRQYKNKEFKNRSYFYP